MNEYEILIYLQIKAVFQRPFLILRGKLYACVNYNFNIIFRVLCCLRDRNKVLLMAQIEMLQREAAEFLLKGAYLSIHKERQTT